MISKKKLWLKILLFFIALIIVPILIFESIMIPKNTESVHRNINLKCLFEDKLNTILVNKRAELLSATDGQIKKGDVFLNYKVAEYDSNTFVLEKGNVEPHVFTVVAPNYSPLSGGGATSRPESHSSTPLQALLSAGGVKKLETKEIF